MYIRTYMHASIHTCIHTDIPTYIHRYIHTYTYGGGGVERDATSDTFGKLKSLNRSVGLSLGRSINLKQHRSHRYPFPPKLSICEDCHCCMLTGDTRPEA